MNWIIRKLQVNTTRDAAKQNEGRTELGLRELYQPSFVFKLWLYFISIESRDVVPSEIRLVIARMWTWGVLRQRVLECGRGDCDGFDFGEASIRALRSCSAQLDNNDFKLISHI